ncbi:MULTISPECIES: FAD-dependent oxidoreductase [Giesbergeria]|uniref:FAD-dependent oxidoreductase n=1 Tax=Giesbergeria sinuosa TaxID=80883 RepID=A0ABV9QG99_9BURK
MQRRHFIASTTTLVSTGLVGCQPAPPPDLPGGFTGINLMRGHALRERLGTGPLPTPHTVRHTRVVIAGAGVAGLAAARGLQLAGLHDFVLLELEDQPGGNSRGGKVGGMACPLGAHYLPLPGDDAPEVQDLLEELGLRQRVAGRWQYDERHLCHSPQERLFFQGHWQEGLLPTQDIGANTQAQYRQFSQAVERLHQQAHFAMPALKTWQARQRLHPTHQQLDALPFAQWLEQQGLNDPYLRWYLDYCCRDDYGASTTQVSAWAGIHYFASRHGFHAPGDSAHGEREGVLTWPEGNGWITQRLATPLQTDGRLQPATSVLRIAQERHNVQVDVFNHATHTLERWQAQRCIVALPVFIAARVVQPTPPFLREAAQRLRWAPWLVANIQIVAPLQDRPGAAPAWDNVLYGDTNLGGLGYVDAGHQRLDPRTAPTVLSYYQALGDLPDGRAQLLQRPWTHWRDAILSTLDTPHPDLRQRAVRMDITRYGHAMSIPVPGTQQFLSQIGLSTPANQGPYRANGERTALRPLPATARLAFAHSDWAGYSVLEEAFTRGHHAGLWASTAL